MVLNVGYLKEGRLGAVRDDIAAVKRACGDAHLKVILETGELGTYDNVRRATLLAIAGGAAAVAGLTLGIIALTK
jgi:deoxyribose-phosphate aldolase